MFYGSQTGTGEEFAGRLAKEGVRYRLKGMVADPEECDMVRIKSFAERKNFKRFFNGFLGGIGEFENNSQFFGSVLYGNLWGG